MVEAEATETFETAVRDAGEDTIRGIKNLVTSPVETASGAVTGVSKLFGTAKESLFGSGRSEDEDSRVDPELIGILSLRTTVGRSYYVSAVISARLGSFAYQA